MPNSYKFSVGQRVMLAKVKCKSMKVTARRESVLQIVFNGGEPLYDVEGYFNHHYWETTVTESELTAIEESK